MKRIIYKNSEGGVSVIIPTESVELALKDVPEGVTYEIVEEADIPSDRTFRGAWVMGDCCIEHDLEQCKDIAHNRRRAQREAEFAPFDDIIAKQIPGVDTTAAEEARQQIRFKYALIQDAIEIASTTGEIKAALEAA
tara:strand:- start:4618 stop:5028 length:411 start_codon:yes stop_codon:yes gene_type:complete